MLHDGLVCNDTNYRSRHLFRIGVMTAQNTHLLPFWLIVHRVIEDQETWYNGLPGTRDALGADQWFHVLPKVQLPTLRYFRWRSGSLIQKLRQSRKADLLANHTQQTTQGLPFFALGQPQQYDHKVLPLALAEAGTKELCKLTQLIIQADNRLGHGFLSGVRFPQTYYPGLAMPFDLNFVKVQR